MADLPLSPVIAPGRDGELVIWLPSGEVRTATPEEAAVIEHQLRHRRANLDWLTE